MLFSDITILDEDFNVRTHSWVGTDQAGRIAFIGSDDPRPAHPAVDFGEVYDGRGKFLMPGLYNAHSHIPMTLLRGYGENVPLQVWLNTLIWPFEAKMTAEDNYWGTALACAEASRYGTVSFSDMYFHSDQRVRAIDEFRMKANFCECLLGFEDKPYGEYPICGQNERFFATLHNSSEGRILMDYNIHAEYTSHPGTCRGVIEAAGEAGRPIHIHISETKSEHEECKQRHGGMTPVQYFESLGAFELPVLAAHCVWVEPEDMRILADHGATAVMCPAANMKLASGFAPVPQLLAAGVNVALGTDGMASNNNHDMFQDMYLLALLSKGNQLDPTVLSPKQVLYAATRAGALAQGRPDCGLVKEGFKADLCVLDIAGPSWMPSSDLACHTVYAGHGSDVVLTMCDGHVVYRDGEWSGIDIERIRFEVESRFQRIVAELR